MLYLKLSCFLNVCSNLTRLKMIFWGEKHVMFIEFFWIRYIKSINFSTVKKMLSTCILPFKLEYFHLYNAILLKSVNKAKNDHNNV